MTETLFDTLIDLTATTEEVVKTGATDALKDARLSAGWLKDAVLIAIDAGDIGRAAGEEIVLAARRLLSKLDAALGWS